MSWYRDSDGKIITDEEFQSDCYECSAFCSEGTITTPCNGERTDCPHFKEVDISDYDKEIRNKVIDEFAKKIKEATYQWFKTGTIAVGMIDEIAEQMKEVGE